MFTVRPILSNSCVTPHNPPVPEGGAEECGRTHRTTQLRRGEGPAKALGRHAWVAHGYYWCVRMGIIGVCAACNPPPPYDTGMRKVMHERQKEVEAHAQQKQKTG